jgi:four helix bundle protein
MSGNQADSPGFRGAPQVRLVDAQTDVPEPAAVGTAVQRPRLGAERSGRNHDPHDHDPHDHDPHEHEHEHEHEHDGVAVAGAFPHDKLDAYRVALKLAAMAKRLAAEIPRGHRSVVDHLLRAASNVVLLLAEGANRRGAAEKRQRFAESRAECGEVAAAADLVLVLDLGSAADAEALKRLAGRVSAMLTGLIGRTGPP